MTATGLMRPTGTGRAARSAAGGVAVILAATYGLRLVNLVITVALARALGPTGMGLVAAALLTVEMIDTIRDFGLREALIYQPGLDPSGIGTAGLMIGLAALVQASVMAGLGLAGKMVGIGPDLAALLLWLAPLFLLTAIGSPQEALLLRRGAFRARAAADLLGVAVKAAVALPLLAEGYGIRSLIWAMLASVLARSVVLWFLAGPPAMARPRRSAVAPLWRYGRHIATVNIVGLLRTKADQYLVAALLLPGALGTYFLAARLPEIAIYAMNVAITTVIFPVFAGIQRDGGGLAGAYLRALRGILLLLAPVATGLAAISPLAVPVLFGPGWEGAVPVLALLSLGGVPMTLGWSAGDVFKATGQPQLLSALSVIEAALCLPILIAVVTIGQSLVWTAAAMALCEVARAALRLWFMERYADVSARQTLATVTPAILAATLMGGAVWLLATMPLPMPPAQRLVLCIVSGVVLHAGLVLLIDPKGVTEARRLVARRRPPPDIPHPSPRRPTS
ncbi:MAG: oligosaccharide flippase family protein [Paracoccaceae bacterium]|nr:oligosaccharide flippase family protein [Paracoccaceae bacterium]